MCYGFLFQATVLVTAENERTDLKFLRSSTGIYELQHKKTVSLFYCRTASFNQCLHGISDGFRSEIR